MVPTGDKLSSSARAKNMSRSLTCRAGTFEREASRLKLNVTAETDPSFRFFAVVFCVVAAVKLLLLAYSGPF